MFRRTLEEAMKNIAFLMSFLVMMDFLITPLVVSKIRKTGNFQYLLSTFHKFMLFVLVLMVGTFFVRTGVGSSFVSFAFCAVFLFLFNYTFEINDYFLNKFQPAKYNLEGMTEAGKLVMMEVFKDMEKENEKSLVEKFENMMVNFQRNISQDLWTIVYLLTNNVSMLEAYEEMQKLSGNDGFFSKMSNRQLFKMFQPRIVANVLTLVFSVIVILA